MAESSQLILNRLLGGASPDYDTSNGSFFYDLFSPVAIELSTTQKEVEELLLKRLIESSTDDDLTTNCSEMGVDRIQGTYSSGVVIVKGHVGATVPQGERVSSELINFVFMETLTIPDSGEISVKVQCEVVGTMGNIPANSIKSFPKTLQGLTGVTNPAPLVGGYDEETDKSLKERYYIKVKTPAVSGNKWHYMQWARETAGVGEAKVVPLWDGRGTVKVIIINADKRGADSILINATHEHIEESRPIGVDVTTVSATEKEINITVNIAIDIDNFTEEQVEASITSNIADYLKTIAFKSTYLSFAKVGALILDTGGVIDYNTLLLNGEAENVIIADSEVAVLGGVVFG